MIYPTLVPLPFEGEVTWANFSDQRPNLVEIKKDIASWNAGTLRPFAGMPRSMEAGYEARMRQAYSNTCDKIDKAPATREALLILGHMWVQAEGFASRIIVDGERFNPEKGAKHILAGFAAIVAGHYRQLRDREEGTKGMNEVAELNTRFGGKEFCPTNEEIDLCCDHALEVEQRSPANPVNPSLFTDARWKAMEGPGPDGRSTDWQQERYVEP